MVARPADNRTGRKGKDDSISLRWTTMGSQTAS